VFGREILDEWGYGTGERVSAAEKIHRRLKNLPAAGRRKKDQKLKISLPNSRMPLKPI
jgi:hypothetical protein